MLLAVTAGSTLYGIAGAFLAVPVAAAGGVVLRYLCERVDRTSVDETRRPGRAGGRAGGGRAAGGEQADAGRVDGAAVNGPAVVDVPSDLRGAVPEPRPDAPKPGAAGDRRRSQRGPPISDERRLPRG